MTSSTKFQIFNSAGNVGEMHPTIFMREIEYQLRKVRMQILDTIEKEKVIAINGEQLLANARSWFLITLHNTDLIVDGTPISAADIVSEMAVQREKIPPYNLIYPSILWFLCLFGKDQVISIFGNSFYLTLKSIMQESNSDCDKGLKIYKKGE
ncbi:MAG: hypothetical protein M1616_05635 [Candidatus Thermoplasmatota archaeon]|nr:hypothetical protein [Candidatus Thermoplasmatota archaeon]